MRNHRYRCLPSFCGIERREGSRGGDGGSDDDDGLRQEEEGN